MAPGKILITGSTGDVGRSLVEEFAGRYGILCMTTKNLQEAPYINGNLCDYSSLLKATKDIWAVIHAAAVVAGSVSLLDEVNVKGTQNLISACKENGVKKIIHISSLDVIFDTPYGVSKMLGEEIVKNSGMDYVILRPALIYGRHFTKGLTTLADMIKKSPVIPVIGSGQNKYQPLHVNDLAAVIMNIIDDDRFSNNSYFIGGADTVTMNQLIDSIGGILGKSVFKVHVPMVVLRAAAVLYKMFGINMGLNNFTLNKSCSNASIQKDLAFKPASLEEGLKKTLLR